MTPTLPRSFFAKHPSALIFIALLALFTLAVTLASEAYGFGALSTSYVKTLGKTLCLCLVALAMDLIWGYAGILSLGHMAFFALGGYMIGMWLMYARTEEIVVQALAQGGLPATPEEISQGIAGQIFGVVGSSDLPAIWAFAHSLPLQLTLALAVPGVLAAVFGWLAFRARVTGVYLSILTQAMTLALALYLFQNDSGLRGNNGLSGLQNLPGLTGVSQDLVSLWFFWASALALGIGYLALAWLVSGKFGSVIRAIRDDEARVRFLGYTPEPVVNFIVRAVDEVLQTEFGLPDGLADTSKVTVDWDTGETKNGKAVTIKKEVHRVQILDPATGTGTFLAEVIKQIAPKIKDVAPGKWSGYIESDLIPRLHGFELLMASYAMCHMKLDMILTEMGYKPTGTPPRLGVYLTNSLEEGKRDVRDLFWGRFLAREAQAANVIKRQTPIMCVIGNPPYSGISQNMGDFIVNLIEDYKYVDGKHFEERKHWLHDDYVKFIRLSESLIAKTGEGVLGFISNHGYLDNPTFRGMRWHLMKTFDRIFVLGSGPIDLLEATAAA